MVANLQVAGLKNIASGRQRILIVSSWRSGSSFVGGLFNSHPGGWGCWQINYLDPPGMMYIYEPFQEYGAKLLRFFLHTKYQQVFSSVSPEGARMRWCWGGSTLSSSAASSTQPHT
jgi:hypothetical protein